MHARHMDRGRGEEDWLAYLLLQLVHVTMATLAPAPDNLLYWYNIMRFLGGKKKFFLPFLSRRKNITKAIRCVSTS